MLRNWLLRRNKAAKIRWVFIVGAERCGTTSIQNVLLQDKSVEYVEEKHFQTSTHGYVGYTFASPFHSKGLQGDREEIRGEIDGNFRDTTRIALHKGPYAMLFPHVMANIRRQFPESLIIISLRNPVDRLVSTFQVGKDHDAGFSRGNFNELIAPLIAEIDDKWDFKNRGDWFQLFQNMNSSVWNLEYGFYYPQVHHIIKLFPRSQVLLLPFEKWTANPEWLSSKLAAFLNLREAPSPLPPQNASQTRIDVDEDVRRELNDTYRLSNRKVLELLDWSPHLWG